MAGSPICFANSGSLPSELLATSAVFTQSTGRLVLTYNAPLQQRNFSNLNAWAIRIGNTIQSPIAGGASGLKATIQTTPSVFDPGADVVDYNPPPNNVRRQIDGLFASAQTLTPTVVP